MPIKMLAHWQRAGHRPIAVMGGATGLIGDPSGKSEERKLLDRDQVEDYAARKGMPMAEAERWLGPNLAYDPGS